FLKADPPCFSRCDEAKIMDEEDAFLKDRCRFEALQFARKRAGERVSKVGRQGRSADGRPIVKLNFVRFTRRLKLPPSLQFSNPVDERRMRPRFSDSARLLQSDDIGGRFFDDAEAIKFQLTDYRGLSRAGSPCQYEPS